MHQLERRLAASRLGKNQLVIERRVLLQQEETGKNPLFAASWIAPAILQLAIWQGIQQQDAPQPLVRICNNVPVCRQILSCKQSRVGALLTSYVGVGPEASCSARVSHPHFDERPAMLIKEVIPVFRTFTGTEL